MDEKSRIENEEAKKKKDDDIDDDSDNQETEEQEGKLPTVLSPTIMESRTREGEGEEVEVEVTGQEQKSRRDTKLAEELTDPEVNEPIVEEAEKEERERKRRDEFAFYRKKLERLMEDHPEDDDNDDEEEEKGPEDDEDLKPYQHTKRQQHNWSRLNQSKLSRKASLKNDDEDDDEDDEDDSDNGDDDDDEDEDDHVDEIIERRTTRQSRIDDSAHNSRSVMIRNNSNNSSNPYSHSSGNPAPNSNGIYHSMANGNNNNDNEPDENILLFTAVFSGPSCLYKLLAIRSLTQQLFLRRTLSYVNKPTKGKTIKQKKFSVDDLLPMKEKQLILSNFSRPPNKILKLNFQGLVTEKSGFENNELITCEISFFEIVHSFESETSNLLTKMRRSIPIFNSTPFFSIREYWNG